MQMPPKALYPSLMELPALAPAQRQALLTQLQESMVRNGQAAVTASAALLPAQPHDADDMLEAAARVRQALAEYASSVTAHQVLASGESPQRIAVAWFRREMNLSDGAHATEQGAWWNVSPAHLLAMLFLVGFAVTEILLRVARRRRTLQLLTQFRLNANEASADLPRAVAGGGLPVPAPVSVTGNWAGVLRVARIFDEAPGVKTFRLAPMAGSELPFMFEPGQFLTVAVSSNGQKSRRSYSIASSPCCHGWCDITVKHVPGGTVSTYLNERVRAGDSLEASGPYGRFTFSGRESPSIVFVAGGIGITPLMSAIRYLTDQSWSGEIFVVYAARRLADVVFREELQTLQKRHPNLHVEFVLSDEPSATWEGTRGRVTRDVLARIVPGIRERTVHLCGPEAMMNSVKGALSELAVPAHAIHTELFLTPELPVPARETAPAAEVASVTFRRSQKSAPLRERDTVLEAAESIGLPIQYACRQGFCGVCKVRLLKGEVKMAVEDGLTPGDRAAGLILACQARATVDIEIDA